MSRQIVRSVLGSMLATLAVLVAPSAAGATVSVTGLVAKPISASSECSVLNEPATIPQAGKRTDFCVGLALSGGGDPRLGDVPGLGDDLKDLTLSLPPGQVATPKAVPLCSRTQFLSDRGCPKASQVGELSLAIDVLGVGRIDERLLSGQVYNLAPTGTEGARLGLSVGVGLGPLNLNGVIHLETVVRLRVADGGLESVTVDAPREFLGIPIEVRRLNLQLWGSKADHPSMAGSFMTTPTSCSPAVTKVLALGRSGAKTNAQTSFTPSGCDKLDVSASAVFTSDRGADQPGQITAGVASEFTDDPLAFAQPKKVTVVMPKGFELSPTAGNRPGLTGCTDAEFGRDSNAPSSCPGASQIGEVRFSSPLLLQGSLQGKAFLGMPKAGAKVRFFVVAEAGPQADAIRVKLEARTVIDPQTGQLTAVLDNLPPTPFTDFSFSFSGGDSAVIAMPRECGTYTSTTTMEPASSAAKTVTASTVIDQGCKGAAEPFAPGLAAGVSPTTAASDTTLTTTFSRPDRSSRLRAMELTLPVGLSGRLTAVPLCALSLAATGSCPAESRIGKVNALAGAGPKPVPITGGDVFLTQGPSGALAGLSIVVPVKIGPLDFGRVITQATIVVGNDTSLTLKVPEIPLRQEGVEANIRQLEVILDKRGFNINASSCAPLEFRGTVTSDRGTTAPVTAPYQATGCDTLPFAPKLAARISGGVENVKEGGHPTLDVTLTQQPGEASQKKVQVVLPDGVSVDSTRLSAICTAAQNAADACPPASVKGTATAYSPLLPEPLTGTVTFVQVPGQALPGLRIRLQGALTLDLTGSVSFGAGNRIVNTIDPVPDTPLSRFELSLKTGPDSPLINTKDLCSQANTIDGTALAQTGATATFRVDADVADCTPAGTLKLGAIGSGRPTLDLRVVGNRSDIGSAQLVVPKGLQFASSAQVRRVLKVSARGLTGGARANVTLSGGAIKVTIPKGQKVSVLRVRIAKGGLRASARLRRQGRPRLTFRLNTTTPDDLVNRTTLRVRPAAR